MGKNGVDGVYDSDPKTNPGAVKFDALGYGEVITRELKVADATAVTLCRDNKLPILVFELLAEGNIARAVKGEKIGTLVGEQGSRA
jgi:uridylate kinase